MKRKLFSEKQIDISAFLAGPIPPGILIYFNYKRLGKEKEAYISLAITIILTIVLFYALLQMPQVILDKIPNFIFSASYGIIVYLFVKNYMARDIQNAYDSGMDKASNWSVTGLTVIGFVLNILIILGLSLNQPYYEGEKLLFRGNEIYYNSSNTSKDQVIRVANKFVEIDFFGEDYNNIARIENFQEKYIISMVVDEQYWTDHELINSLTSMKWLLEVDLNKPIDLRLEHVSLSGKEKIKLL